MTKLLTASEQLAALAGLHQLLQTHGVAYWLFGGWAVDFHAGRVTRAHGDLDVAVWSDDRGRLDALLKRQAWAHTPEASEDGYTCYKLGAVRLEVAFLARDDRGCVYTPLREGRGDWPDETFGDDVAELLGVQARLVRRGALIADKSGDRTDPATTAKDRADVQTLTQRT